MSPVTNGNIAKDDDSVIDDQLGNRLVAGAARGVLEYVARSIVEDPDSVVVEINEETSPIILKLHVAASDIGRVIGKRGRVAYAIRTLVRAAGAQEGLEVSVDIVD